MPAILVKPVVMSIYMVGDKRVLMPSRMCLATPDLQAALYGIRSDLEKAGGELFLSDLFRSYDMQFQAHADFVSGKKSAFSPPPGASMHEAGRAFDIDLTHIKIPLKEFWEIAHRQGVVPIIKTPQSSLSESWHFECRGSHQLVYDYYSLQKGTNFKTPAAAMAASSIIAVGLKHDKYKENYKAAYIQSALIRLGHDIGNIDGNIGPKTDIALNAAGIGKIDQDEQVALLDKLLMKRFPSEFFDKSQDDRNPFLS